MPAPSREDIFSEIRNLSRRLSELERLVLAPLDPIKVGAVDAPAFGSGFSNYTGASGTYRDLEFYRDRGRTYISGVVEKSTAVSGGEVIFTLPSGYEPAETEIFTMTSNGALARVDVAPNGNVVVQVGNATWISLCGIDFRNVT